MAFSSSEFAKKLQAKTVDYFLVSEFRSDGSIVESVCDQITLTVQGIVVRKQPTELLPIISLLHYEANTLYDIFRKYADGTIYYTNDYDFIKVPLEELKAPSYTVIVVTAGKKR